jgi:hypothetical protein
VCETGTLLVLAILRRRAMMMLLHLGVRRRVHRARVHAGKLQECRGKPEAPDGSRNTHHGRAHAHNMALQSYG